MPQSAAPIPQADAERLEAATDRAIAACAGDARDAVKALIVANEFLEAELRATGSMGYVHGQARRVRFKDHQHRLAWARWWDQRMDCRTPR
jgi:hypothetical protein